MHEYKIEHFGHVLAIAFSLSAVFYYVELHEKATERINKALEILADALKGVQQASAGKILELIEASKTGGSMLSMAPRSEAQKVRLIELERERKRNKRQWYLVISAMISIGFSDLATHVLAITSTTVSLGALIHSGYDPEHTFSWRGITTILVLSFASIIWSLSFHRIVLPILLYVLRKSGPVSPTPTPPARNAASRN